MRDQKIVERIAALSPEKRELLLQRLKENQGSKTESGLPKLIFGDREHLHIPFQLSEIQQAYWLGQSGLFDLGDQGSNIYMEYEITGVSLLTKRLLHRRMEKALEKLIKHYDMLRVIILPDGLQQVLTEVSPYQINIVDLRRKDLKVVEKELARSRAQLRVKKTQVKEWPLFDFLGYYVDSNRLILQIRVSALIMDGTSRGKFVGQFVQLVTNPFKKLAPLEVSYRDYVLAWEEFKTDPLYQRAKDDWQRRLPDLLPGPKLPLKEFLEPKTPGHLEAWELELVAADLWAKIETNAVRSGLSPSSVLLTAFIDILAYWSYTPKFSIGIIHTYRPPIHPKIKDILGNFNSVGIVQADVLAGGFIERAKKLQWQVLDIVDSPYYSGLEVLREINSLHARGTKTTIPIFFNSLLNYLEQSKQIEKVNKGSDGQLSAKQKISKRRGLIGKIFQKLQQCLPRFNEREITLYPTQAQLFPTIYQGDNGAINCKWEVANRLFPPGLMKKMIVGYQDLLKRLATDEESWLEGWGQTTRVFQTLENKLSPTNRLLPKKMQTAVSLLSQRMWRQSQRVALISGEKQLTYGELKQIAQRLGRILQERGVTAGQRVVLMMEKGWEAIVAVLGIFQLGAVYLPVEQEISQEKLESLISIHEVKLVLRSASFGQFFSLPEGIQWITVDEETLESVNPLLDSTDLAYDDLACIIHSGIKLTHGTLVELLLDLDERFQITADDKSISQYPITSSLWLYDIFSVLTYGATLVLTAGEEKWDDQQWLELVLKEQITIWSSSSTRLESLVTLIEERTAFSEWPLRLIILSNGSIPLRLVERIKQIEQDTEIYHLWGARDTALWTLVCKLHEEKGYRGACFNRVLQRQQFYIMNSASESTPEWVPGSVYIGVNGWGGYDDRQRVTITHPETGELIVKTDYIGRYIDRGFVEILGLEESFLFVSRGYPVLPYEIQGYLEEHPDVRYALVKIKEDKKKSKYLQAVIAKKRESILEIDDLRQFLEQRLPDYAIPELSFLAAQRRKNSPQGKVEVLRPQTDLTAKIMTIWEQVLQRKSIKITDNFFDLGGDSFKAFQLYLLMQKELKIQIPPMKFFQELTIKHLASL